VFHTAIYEGRNPVMDLSADADTDAMTETPPSISRTT
jgi:hypothetical protein